MKISKLRQLISGENLDSYVSVGSAGYLAETPVGHGHNSHGGEFDGGL